MNAFEKLIADFSSMTGLELVPDERQGCFLETEGLIITIQYRQNLDEVVIFAPVTDADSDALPTKAAYEKALSLAYDGKGTGGASLGLFNGNLILTVHLPMQGLDASLFGAKLMAFSDAAISTRAEIAAADDDGSEAREGDDEALSSATMNLADFIRV